MELRLGKIQLGSCKIFDGTAGGSPGAVAPLSTAGTVHPLACVSIAIYSPYPITTTWMLFVAPLTSTFCTRTRNGVRHVSLYGLRRMNGRCAEPRPLAKFSGSPSRWLFAASYICNRKPGASEELPMSAVIQKSTLVTMRSSAFSRAASAKLSGYHAGTLYLSGARDSGPGTQPADASLRVVSHKPSA